MWGYGDLVVDDVHWCHPHILIRRKLIHTFRFRKSNACVLTLLIIIYGWLIKCLLLYITQLQTLQLLITKHLLLCRIFGVKTLITQLTFRSLGLTHVLIVGSLEVVQYSICIFKFILFSLSHILLIILLLITIRTFPITVHIVDRLYDFHEAGLLMF